MASYNHGRFLRENLDSLLSQTFTDFEIVVVDDGSTDDSLDILLGYQERDRRIVRVLTHDARRNLGMYATLNRAIREGRGQYVAIQGSDDVWLPEKLEMQMSVLDANRTLGAVYCRAYVIDENGAPIESQGIPLIFGDGAPDLVRKLLAHNSVPAMTVVYRRSVLGDEAPFKEELLFADWDLNIRLAVGGQLMYMPVPLAKYRRHAAAATSIPVIIRRSVAERLALMQVVLGYATLKRRSDYREIRETVNRAAAEHALHLAGLAGESGERGYTLKNVASALRLRPRVLLERPREVLAPLRSLLGKGTRA
jgi:glycosyltransferase involved in cell wall biosynthesis